jgi:hypothetical protein
VREISDIRIACTPEQLPNLTAHAPASSKMGPFGAINVKKSKKFCSEDWTGLQTGAIGLCRNGFFQEFVGFASKASESEYWNYGLPDCLTAGRLPCRNPRAVTVSFMRPSSREIQPRYEIQPC